MSVRVEVDLNGVRVPLLLDDEAVATITAAVTPPAPEPSPFLNVEQAAAYLCTSKQRIYDLLSQRRLTRHKDGSRALVSRTEVEEYLRR